MVLHIPQSLKKTVSQIVLLLVRPEERKVLCRHQFFGMENASLLPTSIRCSVVLYSQYVIQLMFR